MWNWPTHGSIPINPFSDSGQLPASCAANSYSESTMRRSSSNQRESVLPERSIAPPVHQKFVQWFVVSTNDCVTLGTATDTGAFENTHTNSSVLLPGADSKYRFVTPPLPTAAICPPDDHAR